MENDKKNWQNEFSREKGNLAIMPKEESVAGKEITVMDKDVLDLKRGGRINVGKLNIFIAPLRRRHEKYYREKKFHLVADIILALTVITLIGAVIWAATFYWQAGKNIFLEVNSVDGEVTSGQLEEFEIIYKNKRGDELKDGNITVAFPKNFTLESVTPENVFGKKTNTFYVGDLDSGANGKIRIKGVPLGEIDSQQIISVIFNYKKNGFKMKTLNSLIYLVADSALRLDLSLPTEIYKGMEFDGAVKVKNAGSRDLENIELVFIDDELEIKQSSRGRDENVMFIDKIRAGEEMTVNFSAVSKRGEGIATFSLAGYLTVGPEKLKQTASAREIVVKTPKLRMELAGDKKAMLADGEVIFRLSYQNEEKEAVSDVNLILSSGNSNFDLSGLSLVRAGSIEKEGKNILRISGLNSDAGGSAEFKIRFLRKVAATEEEVYLLAAVNYRVNGKEARYLVKSPKIKILSSVNAKSVAYYYSPQGDQLGVGPLPPTVDMQTNYWVFWEMDNFGNDLKDATFSVQLPENVVWTGSKSLTAGNLQYGEVARRVIWTVGEVGKNGGNYRVGFEIGVVPSQKDVGKILELLSGISFSAYDNFCGEEITKSGFKNITTNLDGDRLASGKGKVVE